MPTMTTLTVDGMSCQHCVNAITQAVTGADPLAKVTVSLEQRKVTVDSRSLDKGQIRALVEDEGYEVVSS